MVEEVQDDIRFLKASLSEKDFQRLSHFVHTEVGIKMPPAKKTMLEARLQRRLRSLQIRNFTDYLDFVFSPAGFESELVHLIDAITTNKTDFFREPQHFEYLVNKALPELMRTQGAGIRRKLMVWSAGCSTGEEPYTMAMVLSEFSEKNDTDFMIIATDISTKVLDKAKSAIYEEERVIPVPNNLKKKYLLRSKDRSKGLVRIVPELREIIKFRRLNFMDSDFGFRETMDVIFCRNVVIYFDRKTQEQLLNRFARYLARGGYLFMGHSETLNGLNVPFVQVAPTIYRLPHGR
ncbi:CheR family methyltransferase [Candidatus Magnetobacterium casense]|uniref:Protein-glutamate O-methyltransferase n=1 Tax=Candidatus Magnetobacterium casense TaxID=1455061 RepID=A0ABS6S0Q9_9BACT|nr:protein-glutamate O-methyltransferase [Candidatus Magnetobacterium casensis]MBV6342435.1 protein-glutamate O-methyltransferase [Candidatus Magnetobacterium casensis]